MDDSDSIQSIGSDNIQDELTIPKSGKDLKACCNCGLLLNTQQWKEIQERCPNKCDSTQTKNYDGYLMNFNPHVESPV